ncbi:hypothetical protein [Mesorhizobium sp.]|uniref:hypothetical protein n=1 Tax=Mesorhizobium sp. TaxID=1871066 RepID=UPI00258060B3|nr:hypothetical protein [Mesorhizobium sp.]
MRSEMAMTVNFSEVLDAFEFVNSGGAGENQAYQCMETGKIYCHSEWVDDVEELPDDLEDSERYIAIPDKRELDLGNRWCCPSRATTCPTITIRFGRSSAGRVPMPASRIFWSTGAPLIDGTTSSKKPRKKR